MSGERRLAPGLKLGRYRVEQLIGRGGNAEVYEAFDPELQRTIAIKALSALRLRDERARERLVREARAIARVEHPNVVTIFDVVQSGDDVFIAMERLTGGTLGSWLRVRERSLAERLRVFIAAGRGLAAAHRESLVHRDFKPDNVLMDGDVPKVGDFGLAAPAAEVEGAVLAQVASLASTDTGGLVGTPAYMSPEQWLGQPVGARSDQFSFCVALYEALWGKRPFAGTSIAALQRAVTTSKPMVPASGPRALQAIVLRGLDRDPTRRFDSMDQLLDALERAQPRRRRWPLVVGGATIALALTATLVGKSRTRCRDFSAQLASIYGPAQRAAIGAALAKATIGLTPAAIDGVLAQLDRYAVQWVAARETACRATRVEHTQSEQILDLRVACLDQRRAELAQLVSLLGGADNRLAMTAQRAVGTMSSLTACADEQALTGRIAEPDDPALRASIRALASELSAAKASNNAGRYAETRPIADQLLVKAKQTGYAPLIAECYQLSAELSTSLGEYERALDEQRAAALEAERGHDDRVRGDVLVSLIQGLILANKMDEARRDYPIAEAVLTRLARPSLDARLLRAREVMLAISGDYKSALPLAREALAKVRSEPEETRDQRIEATLLQDVGLNLAVIGDPKESLASTEEAEKLLRKLYGDRHPYIGEIMDAKIISYQALGDDARALAESRKNLELRLAILPPDHPKVAVARLRVARLMISQGELAGVTALLDTVDAGKLDAQLKLEVREHRAKLALKEKRFDDAAALYRTILATPRDDRIRAGTWGTWQRDLATALVRGKHRKEADAAHREAMATFTKAYGADSLDVLDEEHLWARELCTAGAATEGRALLDGLAARLAKHDPPMPNLAFESWLSLAECERLLGHAAATTTALDHAAALARAEKDLGDAALTRVDEARRKR